MTLREASGNVMLSSEDLVMEAEQSGSEDMDILGKTFANIGRRYRLISKIGEGTFSTVYKAKDLQHEKGIGEAEERNAGLSGSDSCLTWRERFANRHQFVAIKKIYVTSSPARILNELELLDDLRGSPNVCPLITAFRNQDQVIAILPYFEHKDFRDYYRNFTYREIQAYFSTLLSALTSVHKAGIIHRDIKPTNFLYCPRRQRGVLVDFGLAEREGTEYRDCLCCHQKSERLGTIQSSLYMSAYTATTSIGQSMPRPSYPTNDQRASRRANRAGTRGFRAPEVLLKCTAQTCLIDIWSCGVILLTFLTKRFPFFHAADDIDAFIELCTIFGKKRMSDVAMLHGQILQTNIPTLSERGFSWEKLVAWCNEYSPKRTDGLNPSFMPEEQRAAFDFLKCCMELDHTRRISASEASQHEFLADVL